MSKEIEKKAKDLVLKMSLEEKASLLSGKNFWETRGIERLEVKSFTVTDGPHGLRMQKGDSDHLGLNASVPATCFPAACLTACSFDRDLMKKMGKAMGEECRKEGVGIILGPAANIKRSPLCGRNFEYFSEDPLLSGEMSAALIEGIQSQNVGTSMKHYAMNNQEKARVSSNSVVDERAMREIYLKGFEIAVKKAQPWTLMCSYNKVNDTYASDHKKLISDIPRGEWGFKGAVITDWGAMNDRIEALKAGLDMEMPGPADSNRKLIIEAVKDGRLSEADLDSCAVRMTELALRIAENTPLTYDKDQHNEIAREIARESAVLLKKGEMLPLKKGTKLAVIGDFALTPRYQGAGSSKINPHKITSLIEAMNERGIAYTYAKGYESEGKEDPSLVDEALAKVKSSDVAVVMVGLPDSYESEGFDRSHMNLPDNQNRLMERLVETGKPIVAVLSTGSAVIVPWKDNVDSILLMYLGGQNSGNALLDLLLGDANPSGKLAESWPLTLDDTPCFGFFGGKGNIEYRESIYVGYRYYDKARRAVAYPFGHGLSYTEFSYGDLSLSSANIRGEENLEVSLTVTNTGDRDGKEVVEIYVCPPEESQFRPIMELKAFSKVELKKGESKRITLSLDSSSFSYFDTSSSSWKTEGGVYTIAAGSSSRDIRARAQLRIEGDKTLYKATPSYADPSTSWPPTKEEFESILGHPVPPERSLRPFTVASTLGEVKASFAGRMFYSVIKKNMMKQFSNGSGDGNDELTKILDAMLEDMPLRQLAMLSGDAMTPNVMEGLVEMMNGHYIKGLKKMKS